MLQSSAPLLHLSFITDKYTRAEGTGELRHQNCLLTSDVPCRAHWLGRGPDTTTEQYIGNRYFVKDFTLLDNLMFRPLVITPTSDWGSEG